MIDRTSARLYDNATSPVPSDLGLFKASNQRKVEKRKLNMDLIQRLQQQTSNSSGGAASNENRSLSASYKSAASGSGQKQRQRLQSVISVEEQ